MPDQVAPWLNFAPIRSRQDTNSQSELSDASHRNNVLDTVLFGVTAEQIDCDPYQRVQHKLTAQPSYLSHNIS